MSESSDIYYYDLIVSHFKDNVNFTYVQFCNVKYKHVVLEFKCSVCGKSFYFSKDEIVTKIQRSKSVKNNLSFKYCCKECQKAAYTITKPCLYCGKPVTKRKCEAERYPNFFCNKSCAASYNNKHRIVNRTASYVDKRKYDEYNGIDLTALDTQEYRKICAKIRYEKRLKNKHKASKKTKPKTVKAKRSVVTKSKVCKVCGQIKCTSPHVCNWSSIRRKSLNLQLLGFDFSTFGTIDIIKSYNDFKQKMVNEYQTKSMTQIRKFYNIKADKTIQDIFKYLEIPLIDSNKQLQKYLSNGGTIIPYKGKKCIPYTRVNGTTIICRSSYEVDYARELDQNNINFEFESKQISFTSSIDNNIHYAIPDFYIPNDNSLVEVKSWYFYDQKRMNDRFIAYKKAGYNPKLVLEGIEYTDLPKSKHRTIFTEYPNKI